LIRVFRRRKPEDKRLSGKLKAILGFYPGNLSLYTLAFRHKSSTDGALEGGISNERLEFLGDAILGAVVAAHLYRIFPYKDEGFLTKMRSKIVNRQNINSLADKMGLHELLVSDRGIHKNTSVYGNALEAVIGSIYLDKGYNKARDFVLKRLFATYMDLNEIEKKETDYKSKLIQWAQKEKKELEFRVLNETNNGGAKKYMVGIFADNTLLGSANHGSKKRAEQIASELVFQSFDNNN
jgi:ribonuclease-3